MARPWHALTLATVLVIGAGDRASAQAVPPVPPSPPDPSAVLLPPVVSGPVLDCPSDVRPASADSPLPAPAREPAPVPPVAVEPQRDRTVAAAAPAIRKQAREMGLDIDAIQGTGPGGRITREDLERAASGAKAETAGRAQGPATSGRGGAAPAAAAQRAIT